MLLIFDTHIGSACIYITGIYLLVHSLHCCTVCDFGLLRALLCVHTWRFLCVWPHVIIMAGVQPNGLQDNKITLFHLHVSIIPAFLFLSFVMFFHFCPLSFVCLPKPRADMLSLISLSTPVPSLLMSSNSHSSYWMHLWFNICVVCVCRNMCV